MQIFHPLLSAQILLLVALANGVPLIAQKLLGKRFAYPLDGGITLGDSKPLFGPSKTIRGVVLSIAVTALTAPLIGLDWTTGMIVASMAMSGDILSSFTKRRMKLASGSMALGLDQIPESLFPALACRWILPLTAFDIAAITGLFFAGELLASRALYRLHIRDRPY
ncbi:MAG: CDP-archaeol synthase [Beijerinckiaceae bacterium]|nr:CDP-archaeol synthase [Beijerinckiaceae bacterium]